MKFTSAITLFAIATSALGGATRDLIRREGGDASDAALKEKPSPQMVELTGKTFNEEEMHGLWYVKFYSPYCAKCKEVAPKWTAAFEKYGGSDEAVKWAEVNCSEDGDLCSSQKVNRYPQIHVYQDFKLLGQYEYALEEDEFYIFARLLQKFGASGMSESMKDMKEVVAAEERERNRTIEDFEKDQEAAHDKNLNNNIVAEMSTILENSVADLTEADFGSQRLNKLWFIKFHSPYVEKSREFDAKWKEAFIDLGGIFGTWGMGMAWGEVNCHKNAKFCKKLKVENLPSTWVFLNSELIHKYDGPTEPSDLKAFAKHAIEEWAPKDDEGNLMPITISRGDDGADEAEKEATSKPTIIESTLEDAIEYALKTGGKRVEGDPGLLVFGKDAETQHGIRTFKEHNAPPPSWDNIVASYSQGESIPLSKEQYHDLVEDAHEPWFIKFYSPRCPHCAAMAPEWVKLARNTAGKVNIAEIDCDANLDLCVSLGIKQFPTLRFYHKDKLQPDYVGVRDAGAMEMYALTQTGGQIIPIGSLDDIWGNVTINEGEGRSSFIYLYDKSVMPEDWEALTAFAARMAPLDSVIYRSDDRKVIDRLGIHHHGSTLSFLGTSEALENAGKFAIPYRLSNVPLKLRDPNLLEKWARGVMFSGAQPLRELQIPFMNTIAPVHLVYLLPAGSGNLPEHVTGQLYQMRKLAHEMYEESEKRRAEKENALRVERLMAHDRAVENGEYSLANRLAKTVIDVPMELNLTFSYIPVDKWKERFGSHFDVSEHEEGQLITFDPFNRLYVDTMDNKPFKEVDRDLIFVVVDAIKGYRREKLPFVRKTLRPFKGVKQFDEQLVLRFEDISKAAHKNILAIPIRFLVLSIFALVLYVAYRQFLRPQLHQRRRQRGGILTGKLD